LKKKNEILKNAKHCLCYGMKYLKYSRLSTKYVYIFIIYEYFYKFELNVSKENNTKFYKIGISSYQQDK